MTPNGAVVFAAIIVLATMMSRVSGLLILAALSGLFAIIEVGYRAPTALWRALALTIPLALFMIAVWVGVVGRAPEDIAADQPSSRLSALAYVAVVCARLFLIVAITQAGALRFADLTPLQLIKQLRMPLIFKRLAILTLSLIETLHQSIGRAHTALIASGVLTRRLSVRNLLHGWVLVQTVWLTAITSVTGRMRDKWPIENTLDLLDPLLAEGKAPPFSARDKTWIALGAAAAAVIVWADVYGAP
jgi:hypothetical protein